MFAAISLILSALGIAQTCICAPSGSDAAAAGTTIRIVLAGDSTVTDEEGWGAGLKKCLPKNVECLNMSRGGRSSKSFINEGRWKDCLDAKPDYVLIQCGHNDQLGKGPDRETDLPTYRRFMTQYVEGAYTPSNNVIGKYRLRVAQHSSPTLDSHPQRIHREIRSSHRAAQQKAQQLILVSESFFRVAVYHRAFPFDNYWNCSPSGGFG